MITTGSNNTNERAMRGSLAAARIDTVPPIEWPEITAFSIRRHLKHLQEVVSQVEPISSAIDHGRQRRQAVTALVDSDDMEARPERLEDGAVGQGVEAVRMEEDDVDRTLARSPGERVHRPASRRQSDAKGVHAARRPRLEFSAFPRRPGRWRARSEAAIRSVDSAT